MIKLSALGDVLASTPILTGLKDAFPDANLHHLVMQDASNVTKNLRQVDAQLVLPMFPTRSFLKNIGIVLKLWLRLFKESYDLVFVLHKNPLFAILCRFALSKRVIGFCNTNWGRFMFSSCLPYRVDVNRTEQEYELVKRCGRVLSPLGNLQYVIDIEKVRDFESEINYSEYVVMAPGGGNYHADARNRKLPIESFVEASNLVGMPTVFVGDKADQAECRTVIDKLSKVPYVNLMGKTNLDEAAQVIRNSRLFVGNDSGLLYLAAAVGAVTLGLFGPTDPKSANPRGFTQHSLFTRVPCSPCYNPNDGLRGSMYKCGDNLCMKSISPESIANKMRNLLEPRTIEKP